MKLHLVGPLALLTSDLGDCRATAADRKEDAARDEAAILKSAEAFCEAFPEGRRQGRGCFLDNRRRLHRSNRPRYEGATRH